MPEINEIFIDDPKRLREPIKALEVINSKFISTNWCCSFSLMNSRIIEYLKYFISVIESSNHYSLAGKMEIGAGIFTG